MKKFLILLICLIPLIANATMMTDFTNDASPTTDDIIWTTNAPGTTPADRKVTLGNLLLFFATQDMTLTGTIDASGATFTWPATITTTTFAGALTGNADSATLASTVTIAESTDASSYVAILDSSGATTPQAIKADTALTYNASTGVLTATGFSGPITGAVTGNADTATNIANKGADFTDDSSAPTSTSYVIGYGTTTAYRWTIASLLGLSGWTLTPAGTCFLGFNTTWGCQTSIPLVTIGGFTNSYNVEADGSGNLVSSDTATTGTGAPVKATSPTLVTPLLGTPTSGTLTNCTGLPAAGLVASTSQAVGFGTIELGHASDTTLSRVAAGIAAVEGIVVGGAQTPVIGDADVFDDNCTGACLYGGTFIVSAAGTVILPNATVYMNFTILLEDAVATVIEPLATGTDDTIVLNGTALAQGHNITSSTKGAMCVFQYRAADSWMATCNGFVDGT